MGVLRLTKRGSCLELAIPEAVSKELGLGPDLCLELVRAREGIWLLVELDERALVKSLIEKLRQSNLEQRVEGKFEKQLSREELKCLKELLKSGEVVAFKLSPKYKRAVYKTMEEVERNIKIARPGQPKKGSGKAVEKPAEKESESPLAKEKSFEEYSLEADGFLVCKNEARAKQLSQSLKKEIEDGQIRGVKSFDGFFYIAENGLYEKHRSRALDLIRAEKGISAERVAEGLAISALLAKVVCELLKEDGDIIEKRKNQFQAI